MTDLAATRALILGAARAQGFHRVGLAKVAALPRFAAYEAWLAAGYAGEMTYLAEQAEPRRHPALLLEGARTLVTVALSYAHPAPVTTDEPGPRGTIARYARGADYHTVLKSKLYRLRDRLVESLGEFGCRVAVDTAPILEREAASQGGLGFIAKNTMLIAPGLGSYLLLGELLLDIDCAVEEDLAPAPRCGSCRACLDACPTGAFVDAYQLDARRCISYLTIENPGAIPRELRPLIGDRIFGCDICQEVCPFNAAGHANGAPELAPRTGYDRPGLRRLLGMGAAQFRKWQRQSALRRLHLPQLQRNAAVALGNVGTVDDVPYLAAQLDARHALVREHVAWALGKIGGELATTTLTEQLARETDETVRAEIQLALNQLCSST